MTHASSNNSATQADVFSQYTARLTPSSGYTFGVNYPITGTLLKCTVTMGGTDITSTAYHISGQGEGEMTADRGIVKINSVTGNVVVKVEDREQFDVTLNLSHCSASADDAHAWSDTQYSNVLTPDEGYEFVASGGFGGVTYGEGLNRALYCTITMGGENASGYFNPATGVIDIDDVTGDIIVTVSDTPPETPI